MTMPNGGREPGSSERSAETRFAASNPNGVPSRGESPSDHPSAPPDSASILHDVVAKTIVDDLPLSDAELQALRNVARRYVASPFDVAPVGFAMVESLLAVRYSQYDPAIENWRTMTQQITDAFFAAPMARERLERLWHRLCESLV